MRFVKQLGLVSITVLLLAACGGGSEQAAKVTYSSVVSFGDSLSDAGTYGSQFTVNGVKGAIGSDPTPSYVAVQLIAATITGKPSCAARIGGFTRAVTSVSGCTNYAQGGARVTNPVGPGNSGTAGSFDKALTEPVVRQIQNYLATTGGKFSGTELITVMAGGNDLLSQADALTSRGNAEFATSLITQLVAGASTPTGQGLAYAALVPAVTAAAGASGATPTSIIVAAIGTASQNATANGYTNSAATMANAGAIGLTAQTAAETYVKNTGIQNAVIAMTTAGAELAAYVKDMKAKGATRVMVINMPDASGTPYAVKGGTQALVLPMVTAFNARLAADLKGESGVLMIDMFSESQKQFNTPAQFGLSNVTDAACDMSNLLSVTQCTISTLLAGDKSRFAFADSVHPTPYGHKLMAQLMSKELTLAGWL